MSPWKLDPNLPEACRLYKKGERLVLENISGDEALVDWRYESARVSLFFGVLEGRLFW